MKRSRYSSALLILVPLTIVVSGLYWFQTTKSSTNTEENQLPLTVNSEPVSDFSQSPEKRSTSNNELALNEGQINDDSQAIPNLPADELANTEFPEISRIGTTSIDDSQFLRIQNQLRTDENFRLALLSQLRLNTDPIRGKRLAALLGDINHSQVLQTAAELAYSGDPLSRRIGLDLLSRLQPVNDDARDIAIDLLTSETDPEFLVSTMNVLATPAQNASVDQNTQLVDNLTILSTHPDPNVRSHSITLLSRWNPRTNDRSILVQGLSDENASVRARSTSAFIGKKNISETSLYALLQIAEDNTEVKTTRQSALYALQKSPLPQAIQSRYEQAVIMVRRTRQ